MSEYQYYEFQAVDRPLTEEEQRAVSRLSSRVEPHPRRAIFVYNWGAFSANPREMLVRYFDAMFYVVLDMTRWEEEGYFDWVEGEDTLDGLLPLRDDLMRQDYRTLYLAWLAGIDSWEVAADTIEPPVPPALKELTPPPSATSSTPSPPRTPSPAKSPPSASSSAVSSPTSPPSATFPPPRSPASPPSSSPPPAPSPASSKTSTPSAPAGRTLTTKPSPAPSTSSRRSWV